MPFSSFFFIRLGLSRLSSTYRIYTYILCWSKLSSIKIHFYFLMKLNASAATGHTVTALIGCRCLMHRLFKMESINYREWQVVKNGNDKRKFLARLIWKRKANRITYLQNGLCAEINNRGEGEEYIVCWRFDDDEKRREKAEPVLGHHWRLYISIPLHSVYTCGCPIWDLKISHADYIKQVFCFSQRPLFDNNLQSTLYSKRGLQNVQM